MSNKQFKNYICTVPFKNIELHDKLRVLCCATWLPTFLPENRPLEQTWNSEQANKIRDSILDGSYKFCDSLHCPYLHELKHVGPKGNLGPLVAKSNIDGKTEKMLDNYKSGKLKPTIIQFSFDRTCNLECPSCRVKLFTASKKKITEVKLTIQEIEEKFGDSVETLYITGSGDPFISVGFRDFLRNFDSRKWPVLKMIRLHTNATYWTPKMWDSMKNVHKYVTRAEISIDAATKDTYENKTRIGGDWEKLLDNLKFITTIPTLKSIKPSFVVQQKNYKEMKLFYDLMLSIFGKKADVYYGKITNWGTFSEDQFKKEQVWSPEHPEFNDFVRQVNKTLPAKQAWHNLHEFISKERNLI